MKDETSEEVRGLRQEDQRLRGWEAEKQIKTV